MHEKAYEMSCILLDIKKFLKKLETGQLEIEAGQWELHKDINNLKAAVQDLKQLKTDMELMKQCGVKQTDLIKELELKVTALEQMHASDRWSSTSSSLKEELENDESKSDNNDQFYKVRRKNKCHRFLDEEAFNFKPKERFPKKKSDVDFKPKTEVFIGRQKGQGDSQPSRKLPTQTVTPKFPKTRDHSILQRYLQDSAKYVGREKSHMSYLPNKSNVIKQKRRPETAKSKVGQQNQKKRGNSAKVLKTAVPEKLNSSANPQKLAYKNDLLRYKKAKPLYYCKVCKKYFVCKNHLKRHNMIRGKISKNFKGFKCSYCLKICKSPEKLTAHLKNCRVITKNHIGKKRG